MTVKHFTVDIYFKHLDDVVVKYRSPTVFRKYFMIKLKLELIGITLFKVLGPVRSSVRVLTLEALLSL